MNSAASWSEMGPSVRRSAMSGVVVVAMAATTALVVARAAMAQTIPWPDMPAAVTSFGAAATDTHVYLFAGHIGEAHLYDEESQVDTLHRLNLRRPLAWEALPAGYRAQGTALVTHGGNLYAVAGMEARNSFDKPDDLHSLDTARRFNPADSTWTAVTPLPEARSSHEAIVVGDTLYVVGGWTLAGASADANWAERGFAADLTKNPIEWKPIATIPTATRAFALAAVGERLYVVGGITQTGTTDAAWSYDPATDSWTQQPAIPIEGRMKAFGSAALTVGNVIYVSGYNGRLWQFDPAASEWTDTGHTLKEPRFFHRIVTDGQRLIFIGGASNAAHLSTVESVDLEALAARVLSTLKQATEQTAPSPSATASAGASNWTAFRGDGSSRTTARDLPLRWGSDGAKPAWRTEIPGIGQSSPVIWQGAAYVTSIVHADAEPLKLTRVDLADGRIIWTRSFSASQNWPDNDYTAKAAPTPCVDGAAVYASWGGEGEIAAVSHDGETLWRFNLAGKYGPITGNHGYGSSPAQDAERLYVLLDHGGPSRLIALDKKGGEERWSIEREKRMSWSSPLVVAAGGSTRIVISSNGVLQCFDGASGNSVWSIADVPGNTIQSPVIDGDLLVIGSGTRGGNLGYRLGAEAQSAGEAAPRQIWNADRVASDFASPLITPHGVYFVTKAGVATRVDRETGETHWTLRLPDSCWTTPLLAGDRVYLFCKNGRTIVLKDDGSAEPALLADNNLPTDAVVYGYAAADGLLLVRDGKSLTCVRR